VESPKYGAIVTFSGCVRDEEENAPISAITYEVYAPMAEAELKKIMEEAESKWNVKAYIRHRVGRVPVGEASVAIACAGAHRSEAFQASQFVIEQLKKMVPIWKVRYEKE
jgi:molybdopterin synthase catalytic subunit